MQNPRHDSRRWTSVFCVAGCALGLILFAPASSFAISPFHVAAASAGHPADDSAADPPVLGSFSPQSGPTYGQTAVVVAGSNLVGVTGATIGGVATSAPLVSADGTTATFVTPPSEMAGQQALMLQSSASDGSITLLPIGTFTYVAPHVTSIYPTEVSTAGGTTVTITGSGLFGTFTAEPAALNGAPSAQVTFGGVAGSAVSGTADGTEVTVRAPASPAGPADMRIVLPGMDVVLDNLVSFAAMPAIENVSSPSGLASGGDTVVITGSGFVAGATGVMFGGVPSPVVDVLSPSSLSAVVPPGVAGVADLRVVVQGALSNASSYQYLDITVLPETGTASSGLAVGALLAMVAGVLLRVISRRRDVAPGDVMS